jgi:hypothetical protein
MSLNQEQFAELSNMLVQHFDDDGEELDRVVKYNLGSGLFVDYAARDKFRNVVDQLLTKTEQKGSTVKLFEGVLKVRRDNPDVKAVIVRNLPQVKLEVPNIAREVAAAAQGVQAVRKCLKLGEVHTLVAASRQDLERLASDLDLLARYKTLHDCLHTLQIQFLRLLESTARKLQTDPSASDALIVYVDQLQTKADDAETAAQGLPDTPGERDEQMVWVLKLAKIIDTLRNAVIDVDGNSAVACVFRLKSILRAQPSRLGDLIVITARRTPIASLVRTIERVATASACEEGQARDLANGISALQRLIPDQMGLVAQHSEWQKIADFLWQADELLHQGGPDAFEGFQYVWQDLATMTREIVVSDPASDWAVALTKDVVGFEQQLPTPPSTVMSDQAKRYFGMFMSRANNRFYRVDKALHTQCSEIIKLGQPLRRLLEDIADDGHWRGDK